MTSLKATPEEKGSLYDAEDLDPQLYSDVEEDQQILEVIRADSWTRTKPSLAEQEGTDEEKPPEEKLNTLKGVYLPCLQNILGVILFLRLPFITAQAGTALTSLIVTLCTISTLLTALSLSAVATNGKIREGGPYYIVSRNLGVEFGGAIGLLFYLGTSIAATLYILGGVEAIQLSFLKKDSEDEYSETFTFETQIFALCLAVAMSAVVYGGVGIVNKSAFVFLAVVLLSIVFLMIGVILFAVDARDGELTDDDRAFADNIAPDFEEDPDTGLTPDFFSLLALFYPSVTGIMAGSNRSGVLRNPGASIPVGTLAAIATTYFVYILTVWMFGLFISNDALKDDKLIVAAVAWPVKYCVQVGIVLSTVGAGLQSLTGAPRLLVAIANDGFVPFLQYFAQRPDEPVEETVKRSVLLTYVIASLPCLAGNLDFITPFITMLFLIMYASVNFSCFVLSILRAPGWRPTFKYYHWGTALGGALWCIVLMLIISWWIAILVMAVGAMLLLYIRTQDAKRNWGDAVRGFRLSIVRDQMLTLDTRATLHAKNWRPQIMLVAEIDEYGHPTRPDIIRFTGQLKKGRGLILVNGFLYGDVQSGIEKARAATDVLRAYLREAAVKGFARVIMTKDPADGVFTAVQAAGVGVLQPNCLMFTYPDNVYERTAEEQATFVQMLRSSIACKKTTIVLKGGPNLPDNDHPLEQGTIDIWWVIYDGGVLMLLPYLLSLHAVWKTCKLRLFAVVTSEDASADEVFERTKAFVANVRINAEVIPVTIGDVNAGYAYGKTLVADSNARVAAKSRLLDNLKLPSTMTVAVRGPQREELPKPRSQLSDLFKNPEDEGDEVEEKKQIERPTSSPQAVEKATLETDRTNFERVKDAGMRKWSMDAKRAHMSAFMNEQMTEYSSDAKMIVTNLPVRRSDPPEDVLGFLEALTDGLDNVMMIRGSGEEVVTAYG